MNPKNILMIFSGGEGTTYLTDIIKNEVFIPGYEILDEYHKIQQYNIDINEYRQNVLDLAKYFFNPEKVLISDITVKKLIPEIKKYNYTKQKIIEKRKTQHTLLKWRVPKYIYKYLNNELNIDIILLPIRYTFSIIYNEYFSELNIDHFCKFNSQRNINFKKYIGYFKVNKNLLDKIIKKQVKILNYFKIKYELLKETSIKIIIIDYCYINDNKYLNKKLGDVLNIDFEDLSDDNSNRIQTKKTFDWVDLFDEESKMIIKRETEIYDNTIKKNIIHFLDNLNC